MRFANLTTPMVLPHPKFLVAHQIAQPRVLCIGGGAMRNSFTSGVLAALNGIEDDLDLIMANSSAGPTALALLTKQHDWARKTWIVELTGHEVFGWRKLPFLLQQKTKAFMFADDDEWESLYVRPADVDYLIDVVCADLDLTAALNHRVRVLLAMFDPHTGQTIYEELQTANQARQVLKASCAIPGLARPVDWYGLKLDGGVHHLVPVAEAISLGATKILTIVNRPLVKVNPNNIVQLLFKLFAPLHVTAAALYERVHYWNSTIDLLKNPPANVKIFTIAPDIGTVPLSQPFSRNPKEVLDNWKMGYELGMQQKSAVQDFLKS